MIMCPADLLTKDEAGDVAGAVRPTSSELVHARVVKNRVPVRVSFKDSITTFEMASTVKQANRRQTRTHSGVSPLSFDRAELVAHVCTRSRKCSTHGQAAPSIKAFSPQAAR
jgi:hypothetical protein